MERRWCFSRKNPFLNNHNDQNQDPSSINCTFERETSAKNALFHLAETDLDATDDKTPHLNQWFEPQSKSIAKETPALCRNAKPRTTVHARPFLERNNNFNQPHKNLQESIIPRLKQQLLKLESPCLPIKAQEEKRNSMVTQSKMRKKYQLLMFEEMLKNSQRSVRVKNTPLPRKSVKLAQNHAFQDGKMRKILRRGGSSKQLRQQNKQAKQQSEQLQIWQQARKNRTLNNLLQ